MRLEYLAPGTVCINELSSYGSARYEALLESLSTMLVHNVVGVCGTWDRLLRSSLFCARDELI